MQSYFESEAIPVHRLTHSHALALSLSLSSRNVGHFTFVEIAARMSCPFLSRLSTRFVAQHANSVLRPLILHCPVASSGRVYSSFFGSTDSGPLPTSGSATAGPLELKGDSSHCPFLQSARPTVRPVSDEVANDIVHEEATASVASSPAGMNLVHSCHVSWMHTYLSPSLSSIANKFEYSNFFQQQILKKKQDHSYRVFKKVARTALEPPFASELNFDKQRITVWCSNDYLGMSAHPAVKQSVM